MRPAAEVGASMEDERLDRPSPWRVVVPYGEVALGCDWPAGATALRGAVCEAIGPQAHVDLHGHHEDGSTRQARATVCYRVHGGRPVVWAYGPRAHAHLEEIARLEVLRLPAGGLRHIGEAQICRGEMGCGLHKERWFRYDLATPYFPSSVALARRPPEPLERQAWAGQALASSIRLWLESLGLATEPHRPVHVQVEAGCSEQVTWRDRETRWGFRAVFWSNAILPPGLGLGQHVAEGFGELRPC